MSPSLRQFSIITLVRDTIWNASSHWSYGNGNIYIALVWAHSYVCMLLTPIMYILTYVYVLLFTLLNILTAKFRRHLVAIGGVSYF